MSPDLKKGDPDAYIEAKGLSAQVAQVRAECAKKPKTSWQIVDHDGKISVEMVEDSDSK